MKAVSFTPRGDPSMAQAFGRYPQAHRRQIDDLCDQRIGRCEAAQGRRRMPASNWRLAGYFHRGRQIYHRHCRRQPQRGLRLRGKRHERPIQNDRQRRGRYPSSQGLRSTCCQGTGSRRRFWYSTPSRARAKEVAAGMPLIPKKVVDRIAGGENALRVLREWRGKTQLYISHKSNIGQGYISDLETGRRKGTTAALKKIANVLKVPLDLIV